MPYIKNRDFSKEDIIEDYEKVKRELGKDRLSREEYLQNGQYTRNNIAKQFGTWNGFKLAIGERPLMYKNVSKEDLVKQARQLYDKHGKLTAEIIRSEGYSQPVVDRIFGSFGNMMKELGLKQEAIGKTKQLTDKQFLSDLVEISKKYGYVNHVLLLKHSKIPLGSFINRYGTFSNACLLAGVYHVGDKSLWEDNGEAMTAFHEVADCLKSPKFHTEFTFDWMRNNETGFLMPVDAYFPEYNLIVEYHGPHHYEKDYWLNVGSKGVGLEEIQRRDLLKLNLAKENGLKIVEIPHFEKDNIINILTQYN